MTYLLDIEGTCLPVSFVYESLFPYARKRLLTGATLSEAEQSGLDAEREADLQAGLKPPSGEIDYLVWLMDQDRKSTSLKSVQGRLWKSGFLSGELVAPLYPDVPPALERWHSLGHTIAIFSSGSVEAQQLLFAHTTQGDFSPLLSHYFDTTTGPKKQASSYTAIAAKLNMLPSEIVFVSDIVEELDAARAAGFASRLALRPGNAPQPASAHKPIHTFDE
jgi:enolase-phosphatase E1